MLKTIKIVARTSREQLTALPRTRLLNFRGRGRGRERKGERRRDRENGEEGKGRGGGCPPLAPSKNKRARSVSAMDLSGAALRHHNTHFNLAYSLYAMRSVMAECMIIELAIPADRASS